MFTATDLPDIPWTVVNSDCKKRARLNAIRYVLLNIPYTSKDLSNIGVLDERLVGRPPLRRLMLPQQPAPKKQVRANGRA
jgi:hypothetical protein